MIFVAVFVLLAAAVTAESDRHSLTYIYTAFSNPVGLPGIHKFTAMGLLDDKLIDYYDSDIQKKVPKQDWMKTRMEADYWTKGTESRQSKERWFNVNIGILKQRLHQNDSDFHVLQWQHGCEGDMQSDGSIKFHRGMDMYSYDGNDFLSFDSGHSVWVAPTAAALETKRKWDGVLALKDYTKGYLEKECIDWMSKFVRYGSEQLRKASRPDIYLFSSTSRIETNIILTCMATGFYPKHIILQIKRGDRVLTREDGLISTGPRPNDDNTYQQRDSVEILKSDKSTYKCIIIHHASNLNVEEVWGGKLPDTPNVGVAVGGVLAVILVAVVTGVCLILFKKGIISFNSTPCGSKGFNSTPCGSKASSAASVSTVSSNSATVSVSVESEPLRASNTAAETESGSNVSTDSAISSQSDQDPVPEPAAPLMSATVVV